MDRKAIEQIGTQYLGSAPLEIIRKTIGMCNEVYELRYETESVILRMNKQKEWLYGTHRFLPLFQKLKIKTPVILHEDYSKTVFPFCFQLQSKLEGQDLLLVFKELTSTQLKEVAKEVSLVFDKFNTLPAASDFGLMTGLNEEHHESLLDGFAKHTKIIQERNASSQVIDQDILAIRQELLDKYEAYFLSVQPRIYYDDICSKNVMIHDGKFNGLVDLDFLIKGDYLEAIGRMIADWYGDEKGAFYIQEIIKNQRLDQLQQEIVVVYAIFNLVLWLSEEGIRFNSNSTGEINWNRVEQKRQKILELYHSL